jgi:hypothetical protein
MHPATQGTTAPTSASPTPDLIQLHAQAVNGLNAALRFLTSPSIGADSKAFTQALSRAMRATTALKRACTAMNEVAA